jgi:ribose-phosphate pyrophosphokinase
MSAYVPLLFCGSSHEKLGKELSQLTGIAIGKIALSRFPDGESSVEILEEIRGRDIFILQSIVLNPSFYLMELLIIIDALKRSSARSIIAIIPYFGYCRQDRKDKPGVPITAKLVANLLTIAGATRLITVDLHAGQLEGFFEIPVDHIRCYELLSHTIQQKIGSNFIVVAPDIGSVRIARKIAKFMNVDLAIIEKQRLSTHAIEMILIGEIKGKNVVIADDICSTSETICAAADLCKKHQASQIVAVVTHGICINNAIEKIEESELEFLLQTNSIPENERFSHSKKIFTVSIARLLAEAIKAVLV